MGKPHYKFRRTKRELKKPVPEFQAKGWALNNEKLSRDLYKRLNEIEKPQAYICDRLGLTRSTFWRISRGRPITLETFFKLMGWLDADLNQYIKKNE